MGTRFAGFAAPASVARTGLFVRLCHITVIVRIHIVCKTRNKLACWQELDDYNGYCAMRRGEVNGFQGEDEASRGPVGCVFSKRPGQ